MKDYKFCTQCQSKNKLSAKFCNQCGHRFKKVLLMAKNPDCPSCYTKRRGGAKFCRNCGYEFRPSEAPIKQPLAKGVELPPAATIPPEVAPRKKVEKTSSGKTGILISQEELGKLRQSKTEQIIFVPTLRRKKG